METNEMTPAESLKLIENTIEQSRKDMAARSGDSILWWGCLVFVTSLIVNFLWLRLGPVWNLLWFAMTIVGFGGHYFIKRHRATKALPTSFVGKMTGYIWFSFAIFALSIVFIDDISINCGGFSCKSVLPISATILMLMGLSSTATGLILKEKWLALIGAVSCIVFATLSLMFAMYQMYYIAGAALFTLVLPGVCLNLKNRRNDVQAS